MDHHQVPSYLTMGPTPPERMSHNLVSPFSPPPYMGGPEQMFSPPGAPLQLLLSPSVTPTGGFIGIGRTGPTTALLSGPTFSINNNCIPGIPSPVSMINCTAAANLYEQLKAAGSGIIRYPSPLTIFTPHQPTYSTYATDLRGAQSTLSPHDLIPSMAALDVSNLLDHPLMSPPGPFPNNEVGMSDPPSQRGPILYYQSGTNDTNPSPQQMCFLQQHQQQRHIQNTFPFNRPPPIEMQPCFYDDNNQYVTMGTDRLAMADKQFPSYGYERYRPDRGQLVNQASDWIPPGEEVQKLIVDRVEAMFTDDYLFKDTFMLKHILRNKEGYVNLKLISALRKIKRLTQDWKDVQYSIQKRSRFLTLNREATKVKRTTMPKLWELSVFNNSTLMLAYDVPSTSDPDALNAIKTAISRIPRNSAPEQGTTCSEIFVRCPFVDVVWYKVFPTGSNMPNDTFNFLNQFHCGSGLCTFIVAEYGSVSDANMATDYLNGLYGRKDLTPPNYNLGSEPHGVPWFKLIPQILILNLKLDTPVTNRTNINSGDECSVVSTVGQTFGLPFGDDTNLSDGRLTLAQNRAGSETLIQKPMDSGYANTSSDRSSLQTDSFGESCDSSSLLASSTSFVHRFSEGSRTMGANKLSPENIYPQQAHQNTEPWDPSFRDRSKSLNVGNIRFGSVSNKVPILGMRPTMPSYDRTKAANLQLALGREPLGNALGGSEVAINQLIRTPEYANFVNKYIEMVNLSQQKEVSTTQQHFVQSRAHGGDFHSLNKQHSMMTPPSYQTMVGSGHRQIPIQGNHTKGAHSMDYMFPSNSLDALSKCLTLENCDRTEYADIKNACDNYKVSPLGGTAFRDRQHTWNSAATNTNQDGAGKMSSFHENSNFRSRASTYTPVYSQSSSRAALLNMVKQRSGMTPQDVTSFERSLWRPDQHSYPIQANSVLTDPRNLSFYSSNRNNKDVASQTSLLGTLQLSPSATTTYDRRLNPFTSNDGLNISHSVPKNTPFNASDPSMRIGSDAFTSGEHNARRLSYNAQDSSSPFNTLGSSLGRFNFSSHDQVCYKPLTTPTSEDHSGSGSSSSKLVHSPFSPFSPTCPTMSWLSKSLSVTVKRQPKEPEDGSKGFHNLENIKRA